MKNIPCITNYITNNNGNNVVSHFFSFLNYPSFCYSHKISLLKQEEKWTFLHGRRVDKWLLIEPAELPELEPVKVVWSHLDIIVHSTMLEEKLRVTPEGADVVWARGNPADQPFFAALLRRNIKSKDFEHNGVHRDDCELVLEVILILISPSIDVVGLDLELEGPVRFLLLIAELIKLGQLHDTGAANVICYAGQMFSNGVSCTDVVKFAQDGHPSVLEEVER